MWTAPAALVRLGDDQAGVAGEIRDQGLATAWRLARPSPVANVPAGTCHQRRRRRRRRQGPIRGVGGDPLRTTPHPRTRGVSAESNAPAAGREPPSPPPCKPAFDGAAARPSLTARASGLTACALRLPIMASDRWGCLAGPFIVPRRSRCQGLRSAKCRACGRGRLSTPDSCAAT